MNAHRRHQGENRERGERGETGAPRWGTHAAVGAAVAQAVMAAVRRSQTSHRGHSLSEDSAWGGKKQSVRESADKSTNLEQTPREEVKPTDRVPRKPSSRLETCRSPAATACEPPPFKVAHFPLQTIHPPTNHPSGSSTLKQQPSP